MPRFSTLRVVSGNSLGLVCTLRVKKKPSTFQIIRKKQIKIKQEFSRKPTFRSFFLLKNNNLIIYKFKINYKSENLKYQ